MDTEYFQDVAKAGGTGKSIVATTGAALTAQLKAKIEKSLLKNSRLLLLQLQQQLKKVDLYTKLNLITNRIKNG